MDIGRITHAVKVHLLQIAVDRFHGFGIAGMTWLSPKWTSGEGGIHCDVLATDEAPVALRFGTNDGCLAVAVTSRLGVYMGCCEGAGGPNTALDSVVSVSVPMPCCPAANTIGDGGFAAG